MVAARVARPSRPYGFCAVQVSADAVAKVDKDAEKMAAALKDPVFELQGNKWMVVPPWNR